MPLVLSVYLTIGTRVRLYLVRMKSGLYRNPSNLKPQWSGKSLRSKPFAEWWSNAEDITGWQLERFPSVLLCNSNMQHQEAFTDKSEDLWIWLPYEQTMVTSMSAFLLFTIFRLVVTTLLCAVCDCWSAFVEILMSGAYKVSVNLQTLRRLIKDCPEGLCATHPSDSIFFFTYGRVKTFETFRSWD